MAYFRSVRLARLAVRIPETQPTVVLVVTKVTLALTGLCCGHRLPILEARSAPRARCPVCSSRALNAAVSACKPRFALRAIVASKIPGTSAESSHGCCPTTVTCAMAIAITLLIALRAILIGLAYPRAASKSFVSLLTGAAAGGKVQDSMARAGLDRNNGIFRLTSWEDRAGTKIALWLRIDDSSPGN